MDIPEDLGDLTDEQLAKLASDIVDAGASIQKSGVNDPDALAELEALVAGHQAVSNEIETREETRQQIESRVAEAVSILGLDDPGEGEGDTDAPDAGPDTDTDTDTGTDADAPNTDAALPETVAAAVTPAAQTSSPATHNTPGEEAAVADTNPQDPAAASTDVIDQLNTQVPAQFAPAAGTDNTSGRRPMAHFQNTGVAYPDEKGKRVDSRQLAALVVEYNRQNRGIGDGERRVLATARTAFDEHEMLSTDSYERNFAVMDRAVKDQTGDNGQAIVAAGAMCAPFTPYYDIFHVAEPMSPVEGSFPTVGAPRGGIRYVRPPAWTQAQAGVRFTTAAQNEAGYSGHGGSTAVKPCVHLQCTSILECEVDAISACVSIDNLQSMTFDELVQVFIDDLAIAQAQTKEVYYLDALEAGSTKVTFAPPYGMTRGLSYTIGLAAHAYRKRNHMPLDAPIDWLAPDSMVPALAADMVNDLHLGMEFVNADALTVARELFAKYRVNVAWYYDFSTNYGSRSALQTTQSAGTLNKYTTIFRNYFFAPGTWVRLDGGQLNLGVVRDSTLNSINDFQIFSEEWVQLCKRGIESVQLDVTLCPSGVGPTPGTALACAS